jgi:primary-amine oxidase
VRHLNNAYPSDKLVFRVVTLLEPPKAQMIPYLEAERSGKRDVSAPKRSAFVQFYKNTTADFREVHLELGTGNITKEKDLAGRHSYVDTDEMQAAEDACIASAEVQEAIRLLELPEEAAVCIEPWTYGTDGMNDMSERIIMV